jgi:hypothetical protein
MITHNPGDSPTPCRWSSVEADFGVPNPVETPCQWRVNKSWPQPRRDAVPVEMEYVRRTPPAGGAAPGGAAGCLERRLPLPPDRWGTSGAGVRRVPGPEDSTTPS